jgi:hypothetical protein
MITSQEQMNHQLRLIDAAKAILERLPADVEQLDFESRTEAAVRGDSPNLPTASFPPFDFRLSHYLVYADRTTLQFQNVNPADLTFFAVC